MGTETIELLKTYDPAKMLFPSLHQQKIDGVPVRVKMEEGRKVVAYTRQGEVVTSIPHILQFCSVLLQYEGDSVVMELHIEGKPFKEISGIVRRKEPCRALVGHVFDADWSAYPKATYIDRLRTLAFWIGKIAQQAGTTVMDLQVRPIPGVMVTSEEEADAAHEALMLANPDAEGSVYHHLRKRFQPGKRSWETQKRKPIPTIDLRIVGFEEAISEGGVPLRMVGRINAEYTTLRMDPAGAIPRTEVIGIGPGALNHTQRKLLWAEFKAGKFKPRIAEIRYMRDDSYDALRQPTFKCWRDDKATADVSGI